MLRLPCEALTWSAQPVSLWRCSESRYRSETVAGGEIADAAAVHFAKAAHQIPTCNATDHEWKWAVGSPTPLRIASLKIGYGICG